MALGGDAIAVVGEADRGNDGGSTGGLGGLTSSATGGITNTVSGVTGGLGLGGGAND